MSGRAESSCFTRDRRKRGTDVVSLPPPERESIREGGGESGGYERERERVQPPSQPLRWGFPR